MSKSISAFETIIDTELMERFDHIFLNETGEHKDWIYNDYFDCLLCAPEGAEMSSHTCSASLPIITQAETSANINFQVGSNLSQSQYTYCIDGYPYGQINFPARCTENSAEEEKDTPIATSNSSNTSKLCEKPYQCYGCERCFKRVHDLQRHIRIHTGEYPYTCAGCGKYFRRSDARSRHWKTNKKCSLKHQKVTANTQETKRRMRRQARLAAAAE